MLALPVMPRVPLRTYGWIVFLGHPGETRAGQQPKVSDQQSLKKFLE